MMPRSGRFLIAKKGIGKDEMSPKMTQVMLVSRSCSAPTFSVIIQKRSGPLGESLKACWNKFLKSDNT